MPRLLAAPDKFKGTLAATAVAAAICRAGARRGWACDSLPLADGGDGTLDALGGPNRATTVTGPLGDRVTARWRLEDRTAVIEMAEAAGLTLAGGPDHNSALDATTAGVGELLLAALDAGARRILIGVGGSATTDGGLGMLRAVGSKARFRGVELVVACDVTTRFVDAATDFGPQKGATPSEVSLLARRLERLVDAYNEDYGVDVAELRGAGAAGGLAGGLAALGATLVPGFDLVAETLELDSRIEAADVVVTGEGLVDGGSFSGKVVGGVLALAREVGVGALVVAGRVEVDPGVPFTSLVDEYGPARALADPAACIEDAVAAYLTSLS